MPVTPPIVHSDHAGGAAYLLEWQRLPDGEWGALLAWIEWNGIAWRGRREHVMARDVTRVEGQDYSKVPRRILE